MDGKVGERSGREGKGAMTKDFARDFLARGFQEGEVIQNEVFWAIFGIEEPKGYGSYDEFKKRTMDFMTGMDRLKRGLIDLGHDLENVRNSGYRLIPYQERPKRVADTTNRALVKALGVARKRLNAIPHPEQLTGEAKYLRDAALTKYGHMNAILKVKT